MNAMDRGVFKKFAILLSAVLLAFAPSQEVFARDIALWDTPVTGTAVSKESIELSGEISLVNDDSLAMVPTLSKNEAGVWVVTMSVNSQVIVKYAPPKVKSYTPSFVASNGVAKGCINADGQMEITATEAGTGVAAFQFVNYKGTPVGTPLQIAVYVTDQISTDAYVSKYYENAVFCGDSIIVGLKNYAMKHSDSFFSKAQYLSAGSYSLRYAIKENNPENLHPMYKGQKRVLWESISMIKPERVFLFFGLNDLNISGLQGAVDNYVILADKLKENNPDLEIHVISMTGTLEGTGKKNLSNTKIREFNELLKDKAMEQGWGYIDLESVMADKNGNLKKEYCSDDFVHHSRSAYDQAWTNTFRDYAIQQGEKTKNEK